jgi:PfaB family protein
VGRFAIVGLECLFPDASNAEEFWRNLRAGKDSRREGDASVFGFDLVREPPSSDGTHVIYNTRGGFISKFAFDPNGFRLPAAYLSQLDRVFHWALHVGRGALIDSGYFGREDVLRRTGCVFGNYAFPTVLSTTLSMPLWQEAILDGLSSAGIDLRHDGMVSEYGSIPAENLWVAGMPALVLGQALGLRGPQYAIDAACSSALYSVKLACDHLDTGKVDLMLAGGVCGPDAALIHLSFSDLHAYPKNGVSQPLDSRSTGILTGQGAGMFALKRLADAMRDDDRIYAVIDGIGLTNDGAGKHLLSPNASGQMSAYELAYAVSGIRRQDIDYVECHATGTPLGDQTEIDTLAEFFSRSGQPPFIGSVKANIGHLLTVAGFTSMLKVILAMQHGIIPPTVGLREPIHARNAALSGDKMVTQERPWPQASTRKRAGISAFGFGGTNAHVVMSEPASASPEQINPETPPALDIIGMGAHFGSHANLAAFERANLDIKPAFRRLPPLRWHGFESVCGGLFERAGLAGDQVPDGAYVESFEVDPLAFRIPPRQLDHFNVQHLLLLRVADEAMRDAGFTRGASSSGDHSVTEPRRIGVVVAMEMEPHTHAHRAHYDVPRYLRAQLDRAGVQLNAEQERRLGQIVKNGVHEPITPNEVLSHIGNIMASRISWLWNLTGPSFTLSADSGSGAVALEIASLLLLDKTIEAVLVGAVDLAGGPENVLGRSRTTRLGRGKAGLSLEAEQDGWRFGDGAAALLVTRGDAATAHRRAYARIEANVTRYPGEPAESILGRASAATVRTVAEEALAAAGVEPNQVGYVEIHGSGVPTEDAAEVAGLVSVYSRDRVGQRACAVGSVKALVGDTQNASVLAGVTRAALALSSAHVPGIPGWEAPKAEYLDLANDSAFYFPTETRPWLRQSASARRLAAVNAIGSGGAHTHIVLSSNGAARNGATVDWIGGGGPVVLPVTADTIDSLLDSIQREQQLSGAGQRRMRRAIEAFKPQRLCAVFVAADADGLASELDRAQKDLRGFHDAGKEWSTPAGSYYTPTPIGPNAKVAFVYPGAFSSYPGLAQDLFRTFPSLMPYLESRAERPADALRDGALFPRSVKALDRRQLAMHEAALAEDVPFMLTTGMTFAMLYTQMLRQILGIPVQGAVGYSLGEASMIYAMGGWYDNTAGNDGRLTRTPLFKDRLAGSKQTARELWQIPASVRDSDVWATHVVLANDTPVRELLPRFDRVFLTHVNTRGEVVIAGDPKQCKALIDLLGARSARSPVNHVMHCSVVDSEYRALVELNRYPTRPVQDVVLYTARTYEPLDRFERDAIAEGIAQTLCGTIDFPRLLERAYDDGFRYFVEVGPGSTCTRWVAETLADRPHAAAAVDRRGVTSAAGVARLLARLVSHGLPVELGGLIDHEAEAPERAPMLHQIVCGGESVAARIARDAAPIARELSLTPSVGSAPAPPAEERVRGAMSTQPGEPDRDVITTEAETFAFAPTAAFTRGTARSFDITLGQPAAPARTGAPPLTGQVADVIQNLRLQVLEAHAAAMRAQQAMQAQALTRLEARLQHGQTGPSVAPSIDASNGTAAPAPTVTRPPKPEGVVWDEADLLEFATGRASAVFGPEFDIVDTYPKRVRLPAPPYLFVTRVTDLRAKTGVYEPSFIRSEYDVPGNAWFSIDGQMPAAVTIEAGQCDLILISYLGIDFANKGQRVYRLLDSTLSFCGELPLEGETVRYDISINRFVRMGETLLFFFGYKSYVNDRLILELKDACAGFFTQQELDRSGGIVLTERERKARQELSPKHFKPLAKSSRRRLDKHDFHLLAEHRIGEVFGPDYDQGAANPSLRIPGDMLQMVDEVLFDEHAGPRGLGHLTASKRLDPSAWYFSSHFTDDPVLAGSLVAEGVVQILDAYALFLGLHLTLPNARFQPVLGLDINVKVRGQITPAAPSLTYQVDIVDIDLLPRPRVVADVLVYAGDKAVVSIHNIGMEIREKPATPYRPEARSVAPLFVGKGGRKYLLTELHLAHAAKGDLSVAMGEDFSIYSDLRAPYIPNGKFQFVDRATSLEGERGVLKPGARMSTEYDSPADAWYYHANGYPFMPNVVIMESSLQSAILLGYYLGATLRFPDQEFSIRNLDGRATMVRDVDLREKTISQTSTMTMSTAVQGSVLQRFSYELSADGEPFYRGESQFGYFVPQALATQVGLDAGAYVAPWIERQAGSAPARHRIDLAQDRSYFARPGLRLASGELELIDWLEVVEGGGDYGAGYARGYRTIRPTEWYFENHFYRDPVMPGSLGVEAIIQGLQLYVIEMDLARDIPNPRFAMPIGIEMSWKYRGQILRNDGDMQFELHIKEVRREPARLLVVADASLWKPQLRIYELHNVSVEVRTAEEERTL